MRKSFYELIKDCPDKAFVEQLREAQAEFNMVTEDNKPQVLKKLIEKTGNREMVTTVEGWGCPSKK